MKKLFILLISFAIFVVAAIVTITHTYSAEDNLLMENAAALADDPVDWDEEYYDDGSGGNTTKKCYKTISTEPNGSHKFRVKLCMTNGLCSNDVEVYSASNEGKCHM